jgi:hypothetical protein
MLWRRRLRRGDYRLRQEVERAGCRTDLAGGNPQISGGRGEAAVPQQQLDRADIGAGLEEMHGEGVAKGMRRDKLGYSGAAAGQLAGQLDG